MGQRQQTQNFFVKNGSVARLGIYGLRIEDFASISWGYRDVFSMCQYGHEKITIFHSENMF
jgi:hypothetical protein